MKRSPLLALLISPSVWFSPGLASAETAAIAPKTAPPADKPAPEVGKSAASAPLPTAEVGATKSPSDAAPAQSGAAPAPESPTASAPSASTEAGAPPEASGTAPADGAAAPPAPPSSEASPAAPAAGSTQPTESPQGATPVGRAAPPPTDLSALNEEEAVPEEEPSKFLIGITWDFSLPLGNTADFTDAFGIQGFSLEVKYIALGRLGFGGMVSWHSLGERTFARLEDGNATLTGTQVRELSFNPITLRAHYAFSDRRTKPKKPGDTAFQLEVTPYVALGLGGARAASRVDLGIDVVTRESWHFTLVPELGLELPVGPVILLGSTRLNLLAGSGDRDEQLYVNFNLGAAFR